MHTYQYFKWKTWLVMAAAFVFSLFHRGALSVISPILVDELHLNATALSNVASITYYTYAIMQIPAGIMLDTYGYRWVSCGGVVIAGIGSVLIGFSHGVEMLLVARFLIGLGTSVLFISALKAQRIWFSQREIIKVSGYLSFVGCLGSIGATFPLAMLAQSLGWRETMIIIGVLCILLGIVIFTWLLDGPEDLAMDESLTQPKSSTTQPTVKESIQTNSAKRPIGSFRKTLANCLRNIATIRNFLILFTTTGATTALTGLWGIPFLIHQYQMTSSMAAFYMAFVMYGSLIGALMINGIATYFQNDLMRMPRYALMAQFGLWFLFLRTFDGRPPLMILALFLFLLGFLSTTHLISFVDINVHLPGDDSGLASSIINAGEFAGSTLISISIGWILDMTFLGTTINGIRMYESSQFLLAFSCFAMLSLLGIVSTYLTSSKQEIS